MEQVVRAVLGDAFSDVELMSVTATRSGNNKQTVVVTLADGEQLVVQYRDLEYGSLEPEGQITKVVDSRTTVPVPAVLASGRVEGYSYVITRLVDGTNLHPEFGSLNPEHRRIVAHTLGQYLGSIHETFTFEGYGQVAVTDSHLEVRQPATDWLSWLWEYIDDGLAAFTGPLADLIDPITETLEVTVENLPTQPTPRLFPWDYRPGNVLLTEPGHPGIAAIVDWGDPLAAHRELSLAKSEYLIADWYVEEEADRLRDAFHTGYRSTSTIPRAYFDERRRPYRLIGILRSAIDSNGEITRPRYPLTDVTTAAAFHRSNIEALLETTPR